MPLYSLDGTAPETPLASEWWLAPDAHVIGRVSLGVGVGIWFGSVLRGDNEWIEIGPNTNIQEGCILHTDMGFPLKVGSGSTVGHRAILHGCTVGDNSLIGMGATVLNGARIGSNSIVGANSLVTEGKVFPDNVQIVGAPARVVRELDAAAADRIASSARAYVSRWQQYAGGMRAIAGPDL